MADHDDVQAMLEELGERLYVQWRTEDKRTWHEQTNEVRHAWRLIAHGALLYAMALPAAKGLLIAEHLAPLTVRDAIRAQINR